MSPLPLLSLLLVLASFHASQGVGVPNTCNLRQCVLGSTNPNEQCWATNSDDPAFCCNGTCMTPPRTLPFNASCDYSTNQCAAAICEQGMSCDFVTQRCRPNPPNPPVNFGCACSLDSECYLGVCINGFCAESSLNMRAPCLFDRQCRSGVCDNATSVCAMKPTAASGGACDRYVPCPDGQFCFTNITFTPNIETGVCMARATVGATCLPNGQSQHANRNWYRNHCDPPLKTIYNSCPDGYLCQSADNGATYTCLSYTDNLAYIPVGQPCPLDEYCVTGAVCNLGTCIQPCSVADGAPCSNDLACTESCVVSDVYGDTYTGVCGSTAALMRLNQLSLNTRLPGQSCAYDSQCIGIAVCNDAQVCENTTNALCGPALVGSPSSSCGNGLCVCGMTDYTCVADPTTQCAYVNAEWHYQYELLVANLSMAQQAERTVRPFSSYYGAVELENNVVLRAYIDYICCMGCSLPTDMSHLAPGTVVNCTSKTATFSAQACATQNLTCVGQTPPPPYSTTATPTTSPATTSTTTTTTTSTGPSTSASATATATAANVTSTTTSGAAARSTAGWLVLTVLGSVLTIILL